MPSSLTLVIFLPHDYMCCQYIYEQAVLLPYIALITGCLQPNGIMFTAQLQTPHQDRDLFQFSRQRELMICISRSIQYTTESTEILTIRGVIKVFNIHNTHMIKAFYRREYFKHGLGGRRISCSMKMEKVLKPISDVLHSATSSILSF